MGVLELSTRTDFTTIKNYKNLHSCLLSSLIYKDFTINQSIEVDFRKILFVKRGCF